MPISVPANQPYKSPVIAMPSNFQKAAVEGPRFIPAEILWNDYSTRAVYMNLTGNATLDFSQVSALWVDNSQNGRDVTFIFLTAGSTVVVPATESVMVPVPATVTEFYVTCQGALSTDVTRFDVYNFVPPPVVLPKTQFQASAAGGAIVFANGSVTIVGATANGTLQNLAVYASWVSTGAFSFGFGLQDGAGTNIAFGALVGPAAAAGNQQILNLNDIEVRFSGGITLTQTGTYPTAGGLYCNAYYRQP